MIDFVYKFFIVVLIGNFFMFNLLFFGFNFIVIWGLDRFLCVCIGVYKFFKIY